jgi:2-iminobutanoate/2-iminopropanoate deaminase
MKKEISTGAAPGAIGPYAQGICGGGLIFTSGQIGLDPATGELVPGGVEAQTRQALKNLQSVLEAGGGSLETVVKTTVFLTHMGDFQTVNQVYGEFFQKKPLPARSAVAVLQLPKDAQVEIECIALEK